MRLTPVALSVVTPTHFEFEGRRYRYFWEPGRRTWRGERAIEVPIIRATLTSGRLLEVGNVLGQFGMTGHDVVDKYDRCPGIINADAVAFDGGPYDLIVSISTLEHIGYDEEPREPQKAPRAVANLRSLLAPGGLLVATVPLAYNRDFDDWLLASDAQLGFMRRESWFRWREATGGDTRVQFGYPWIGATGLAVARWRAPA